MSGLLAGKVWLSDLPPELKPLAATLADIADDDGTSIYPSIAYIAWRLSRTRRSVDDGLASLRESGVLVVVDQGGGRAKVTEYQMIEANLPKRLSWQEFRNHATVAQFKEETTQSVQETTQSTTETTHPSTYDPSVSVIDPSLKAKPCEKCGNLTQGHKCPGYLSTKQRAKNQIRSSGERPKPSFAKRVPFETERAPKYQQRTYPKPQDDSDTEGVEIDSDYPRLRPPQ